MRKVDDGKKKKRENNVFLVATNVVASRPPQRRPTGTPHAHANRMYKRLKYVINRVDCLTFDCFKGHSKVPDNSGRQIEVF